MMKRAVALGIPLLVVIAGSGAAAPVRRDVDIPGKLFVPPHVVALVGDTVTWANDDASTHTVTADDQSFDSGELRPGQTFSRTFDTAGTYVYHCIIHRFMRGEIEVVALMLKSPGYAVPIGVTTALKGLAPPSAASVVIERIDSSGSTAVGTVPISTDGTFRFPFVATESTTYVASTAGLTSRPVHVVVASRLKIAAVADGNHVKVRVATMPAQPGARVQIERYVYELFAFVPFGRTRLDAVGHATFTVTAGHTLHVRAVLPRGVAGYGRAFSRTILVRRPRHPRGVA
jgi:plastocyanin